MLFWEDGEERYGSHNDTNVLNTDIKKKKKKWVFPGGSEVKNLPANARDTRDPGSVPWWEDLLEEEMATHSSILAWNIPWTVELGGSHKELDVTEQMSTLQYY